MVPNIRRDLPQDGDDLYANLEVIDFEDSLREPDLHLEEFGDDLNDDTFGIETKDIGRDFDFFASTARFAPPVAAAASSGKPDLLVDQQSHYGAGSFVRHQPQKSQKIPDLAPAESIWGTKLAKKPNSEAVSPQKHKDEEKHFPSQEFTVEDLERQMQMRRTQQSQQEIAPQEKAPHQHFLTEDEILAELRRKAPIASEETSSDKSSDQKALIGQAVSMILDRDESDVRQASSKPINALSVEEIEKSRRVDLELKKIDKYKGLMTRKDISFIAKIQLSQILSEDASMDDFYYQIWCAIRKQTSKAGQDPSEWLNEKNDGIDTPDREMQLQVRRIVASARERAHAIGDLSPAGSLGRVAAHHIGKPRKVITADVLTKTDHKKAESPTFSSYKMFHRSMLRSVESLYTHILEYESTLSTRSIGVDQQTTEKQKQGRVANSLNQIWDDLHIMDDPESTSEYSVHPFLTILSFYKAKKALPRFFYHFSEDRRLTILSVIIAHLQDVDAVRDAIDIKPGEDRSELEFTVDVFMRTVFPLLMKEISKVPYRMVLGLIEIFLEKNDIMEVVQTKVGASVIIVLISHAESLSALSENDREDWSAVFDKFFDMMKGKFAQVFSKTSSQFSSEPFAWQFLTASAASASPAQQRELVSELRTKVIQNIIASRKLPTNEASKKLSNVNLFLNAMGIDAAQLTL